MKVFVLGSTGMLGRYVSKYLKEYYDVVEVSRKDLDVSSITEDQFSKVLDTILGVKSKDVIINCIGTIKPRVDELGDLNAIKINSLFPRILANYCVVKDVNLIHPTTDCIYSGYKGKYDENSVLDVHDVYGMTKGLGEPLNCTVIRTSIIGEEVGQSRSLVEWIKSNKNGNVFGYTNHYWNGMTCLQFAKVCKEIIDKNSYWYGIRHLHSDTVSKKELVDLVSDVYGLNVKVTPKDADVAIDRTLSTIYNSGINIPSLREQIIEMKEFSDILYELESEKVN